MSTAFGYRPSYSSPFFPPSRGHNIARSLIAERRATEARAAAEAARKTAEARVAAERARMVADERRRRAVDKIVRRLVIPAIPSLADILTDVAKAHGLNPLDIKKHRRHRHIVQARHEAFWRAHKETTRSLPEIGQFFGGFDHTTVLHGVRAHEKRLAGEGRR